MHVSGFIGLAKFQHLSGITGREMLTGLFNTSRRSGDTQSLNALSSRTCEEPFIWSTVWKQPSVTCHEETLG